MCVVPKNSAGFKTTGFEPPDPVKKTAHWLKGGVGEKLNYHYKQTPAATSKRVRRRTKMNELIVLFPEESSRQKPRPNRDDGILVSSDHHPNQVQALDLGSCASTSQCSLDTLRQ